MNFLKMIKQAKEIKEKMDVLQKEMASVTIQGHSGGDMVSVTLDGKGTMQSLSIDPSLMTSDEISTLQDLVCAAHADAKKKLDVVLQEKTKDVMSGMNLPTDAQLPN